MITMACGCQGNKSGATSTASAGTYRVMVGSRQVYESSNQAAADTVAARFDNATVLAPGQDA